MFFLIVLALTQHSAWAEEGRVCPGVQTPNDIMQCVRERSPEAKRLMILRDAGESESKSIRRWLNPELTNQSLFAKSRGESRSQIQLGLLQPVEFGSRVSFKTQAAEAVQQRSQSEQKLGLAETLIQTGRDLLRLEQLHREQSAIREAIETYRQLIRQFGERPRLSPEQEVSLSVYQLSLSDFSLRDEATERERQEILARLKTQLQLEASELVGLPRSKIQFKEVTTLELDQSPKLRWFESEVKSSTASLSLERADAFSQISIGPMVQFDSDGPAKTNWFGFQLSMPIPLWNQNGHGVDSAAQKLKAAEIQYSLQRRGLDEEFRVLAQNYSRYRGLLKQIPDDEELERKHKKMESQFHRGLVNSALVVESHRSLVEVQKNRHEAELNATTSLWKIYQIQGKVEEIQL